MWKIRYHALLPVVLVALLTSAVQGQRKENVSVNGLSFAFVEKGSGPALVLVHGSVSDYREWSEQMAPFAQHYRVVAYSRRYHWPNVGPGKDADASVERQADDLAGIIRALGLSPANVVGHSFGGAVALNLALRHPELVRTLVLAEPAVSGVLENIPTNEAVLRESQAIRVEMREAFASGDAQRIVRTYATHVAPGDFEKASTMVRRMLIANVPAFQLDFTSPRPPFTCEDARRIEVPVLVLSGDQSPIGLQRIAEVSARCMKRGSLVKIPRATHWLQHDQPLVFNEAVLQFLSSNGK